MMPLLLLLLLIGAPLLELYVIIKVGGAIGAGITVFLVVATAILGIGLIRAQGVGTRERLQAKLARGEAPAMEVLEAAALLVAGGMLLAPGFITDTFGFILLVPPLRRLLIRAGVRHTASVRFGGFHDPRGGGPDPRSPRTFDGEAWSDDDDRDPPHFPRS